MRKYFLNKYILFAIMLSHSLTSMAYIDSVWNGSTVNGYIQLYSDQGYRSEIQYYGDYGWQFLGYSGVTFDTRSVRNGTYQFRDCFDYVSSTTVCYDDHVWVPRVEWVSDLIWVSDPVEYCEDNWESDWVWVSDPQCTAYDENGDCTDYEDDGYWEDQGDYVTTCSIVDEGYWEDDGYWVDNGYWDTETTCTDKDVSEWVCDYPVNLTIKNTVTPPNNNTLNLNCPMSTTTNLSNNAEAVSCNANVNGTVNNISWFARSGTNGDFVALTSCKLNANHTTLECNNVPAGTYQVKASGDSPLGRVDSNIVTLNVTTLNIACLPKDAHAGTKGATINCTATPYGTPVAGSILASGYWSASYIDAKTNKEVKVPKFCENLVNCMIPSVPAGSYEVQAFAKDKYGNDVISNKIKVNVLP